MHSALQCPPCARRKDTYDAAFFAKARASRLVRSVQEAEALSNADARIM
jgi:hypothetical protein